MGSNGGPGVFTLTDVDLEHESAALSPGGSHSHRPQAVFNLDLDHYSDDDALLDWEQYSVMRRIRCCGCDCTAIAKRLPCFSPPDWWYSFTKRQRRCLATTAGFLATFVALLLLLVAARATGAWPAGGMCSWAQVRLPAGVAPQQYNLTLDVQMEPPYLVAGTVSIAVNISEGVTTRCIVLHAAGMEVTAAHLDGPDGTPGRLSLNPALEQATVSFRHAVPGPTAVLHLTFQYTLKPGLSGFYRSNYSRPDGSEAVLATTQFEAASARSAFPCFDEPALKAVFQLEIVAPEGQTVLSNSPTRVAHHHHDDPEEAGLKWHFQPTPPMSSYLLAFVVGDLASVTRTLPGGRNVSVWGTPDRVGALEYAADTVAAILPAYESAFGVPFALPKLDLVAIPDFSAGAMENWGLITYRETALLVSRTSSQLDRRWVAQVIAHEMAHMWFGDLVTMAWWGEIWLNEGFASYFEYVGATAAAPGEAYFSSYYPNEHPAALFTDSKAASHPLATLQGVETSAKVESLFDSISYNKGGAVLRMLRAWANRNSTAFPPPTHETSPGAAPGTDPFLRGLQQYLQAHQYHCTTSEDLWASLDATLGGDTATGMRLPDRMRAWTYRQGYPVLQVFVDEERQVRVIQYPYTLASGLEPCSADEAWWVPLAYTTSDAPTHLRWAELHGCQTDAPLATLPPGNGSWIKLNAQQYAFARVTYPSEMWAALAAAARMAPGSKGDAAALPGVDLAGLLEDSYSLAEAGELDIRPFLALVSSLSARPPQEHEPWAVALPYLYHINRLLGGGACGAAWRRYLSQQLLGGFLGGAGGGSTGGTGSTGGGRNGSAALLAFSFQGNGSTSVPLAEQGVGYRLLRPAVLKAAGYFGNYELRAEALNLMQALSEGKGGLDPDVRSAVYQTAARTGDAEIYVQLLDLYRSAKDADERERALGALGYAGAGGQVAETLRLALGPEVRAQDVAMLALTVASQSNANATWAWLKANYGALHAKLGGDSEASRRLGQMLQGVASLFATEGMAAEAEAVFAEHEDTQPEKVYLQLAVESIGANARWMERHAAGVCAWAEAQAGGP